MDAQDLAPKTEKPRRLLNGYAKKDVHDLAAFKIGYFVRDNTNAYHRSLDRQCSLRRHVAKDASGHGIPMDAELRDVVTSKLNVRHPPRRAGVIDHAPARGRKEVRDKVTCCYRVRTPNSACASRSIHANGRLVEVKL